MAVFSGGCSRIPGPGSSSPFIFTCLNFFAGSTVLFAVGAFPPHDGAG